MNITTWKSCTGDNYLAQIEFGGDLRMSFFGASEADVKARAENWYAAEKARQFKIFPEGASRVAAPSEKRTSDNPRPSAYGHGLKGMVWMVNRSTHHLTRVSPAEAAKLEAQGYEKGGPRSKV